MYNGVDVLLKTINNCPPSPSKPKLTLTTSQNVPCDFCVFFESLCVIALSIDLAKKSLPVQPQKSLSLQLQKKEKRQVVSRYKLILSFAGAENATSFPATFTPFLMSFQNLNLIEPVMKALAVEGYTTPTPIQQQSIPFVLQGRDLQGCA